MLIASMINAKLQEHRILHNKHLTFCGFTKERTKCLGSEENVPDEPWSASLLCTWVLCVSACMCVCVSVCLAHSPSD